MFEALEKFRQALKDDPDYARSWHDNIACQIMGAGMSHGAANRAASRIMRHCFEVETASPGERQDVPYRSANEG